MANDAGRSVGLGIARVCIAALFIYTGFMGIQHTAQTAEGLAAMGYPAPNVLAMVAAAAQLAGGISLLVGLLTPLGCIALILFLLPTTYSFHLPGLLKGDPRQTVDTLKNLAIVGGLIAMLFTGPGRFSIDGRIKGPR
jgi:putative oxidoreductase